MEKKRAGRCDKIGIDTIKVLPSVCSCQMEMSLERQKQELAVRGVLGALLGSGSAAALLGLFKRQVLLGKGYLGNASLVPCLGTFPVPRKPTSQLEEPLRRHNEGLRAREAMEAQQDVSQTPIKLLAALSPVSQHTAPPPCPPVSPPLRNCAVLGSGSDAGGVPMPLHHQFASFQLLAGTHAAFPCTEGIP